MAMVDTSQPREPSSTFRYTGLLLYFVLLFVLTAIAIDQWSAARELQQQLAQVSVKLDQLGAIQLTDPDRLHLRWLPTRRQQQELACRLFVPANKSYRILIHAGTIPAGEQLPTDGDGLQLTVDIPPHPTHREVLALGGFHFNVKQGTWQMACRIHDPSGVEYPLNGASLFIPPAYQRYFTVKHAAKRFEMSIERDKTCVFPAGIDHFRLATAKMYEYPVDVEGNTDFELGGSSLNEWLKSQNQTDGEGFVFWIERANKAEQSYAARGDN